jgi:hypothetical protein
MGSVSFTAGTQQFAVASGDASPVLEFAAGPLVVSASAVSANTGRTVGLQDASATDIIAYESPPGVLNLDAIPDQVPGIDASKALLTMFGKGAASTVDAYLLPAGTSIASVAPTIMAADGSQVLAPDTYTLAFAPPGQKTVLYASSPLALAAGQQLVVIVAPGPAGATTPVAIEVPFDGAPQTLNDARPSVKLLKRINDPEGEGLGTPTTITVDGTLLVQLQSATQTNGISYHLAAGLHRFEERGAGGAPPAFDFQISDGTTYVQRYGFTYDGPILAGDIYLPPSVASDYPVPSNKARVRLIVENVCRDNMIRVDGNPISYGNQQMGNSGVVIDRDAGSIQVEADSPDGLVSEGKRSISLDSGHYYVIRVLGFWPPEFPPCNPDEDRIFEMSSD